METIRSSIQSMSMGEDDLVSLHETLEANDAQEVMKETSIESIDETIQQLDISKHGLGILHLLACKARMFKGVLGRSIEATKVDDQLLSRFMEQAIHFLLSFSVKQVQMAHQQFALVCRALTHVAIAKRQSLRTVAPLRHAMDHFCSNQHSLTPIHTCFVLACLHSKRYQDALPILDVPFYEVDVKPSYTNIVDFLSYFYYGGMIYLGMKKFVQAADCFLTVITAPASAVSAIAIEAYRKYILVNYIVCGETAQLPKCTSSVVSRFTKTRCELYNDFVSALFNGELSKAMELIKENESKYKSHNNLGLVKHCLEACKQRRIKKLTHTYITLSLQNIAKCADLKDATEAEQYVLNMIDSNDINASIDQENGMVTFVEDQPEIEHASMLSHLQKQLQEITTFTKQLKSVDTELLLDPTFIQKTTMMERQGQSVAPTTPRSSDNNSSSSSSTWMSRATPGNASMTMT